MTFLSDMYASSTDILVRYQLLHTGQMLLKQTISFPAAVSAPRLSAAKTYFEKKLRTYYRTTFQVALLCRYVLWQIFH